MQKKSLFFLLILTVFGLHVMTGCPGCNFWSKPKLPIVNPTRYLETGGEIWEQINLKGEPSGFQHTTVVKKQDEQNGEIFEITQETVIQANRFDRHVQNSQKTIVHQKPDGTLIKAQNTVQSLDRQPVVTIFAMDEHGKMAVHSTVDSVSGEIDADAVPHTREIDWKPETLGPFAVLFSLWQNPMKTGESRNVRYFDVMFEEIVQVEMNAEKIETISYYNDETTLLRINAVLKNDRQTIAVFTFWTDVNGNIVKTVFPSQEMEIVLSTREKVKAANTNPGNVNVILQALVPVQGMINNPRETKQTVFRVQWIGDKNQPLATSPLAQMIPQSAFQTVREAGPDVVEVTVTSSRQDSLSELGAFVPQMPKETTEKGDQESNEWLQANYPNIVKLANVASENTFVPQVAVDLEKFVHDKLQQVDYSDSFAAAGDVARTLKGDSAAYAVLLAAVARARNIPSRVVSGLVYTQTKTGEGVMVFHFWTELYVDGHWHSFDATLGRGGTDASRIILARSNLANEPISSLLMPMMTLAGHVQVTIMETK
ncbi:MAG: transglutaminase domain-containing protein [Planctomycetaceae bacterium]|nr:transglutaminase domain-containing protein [Planctomycetaceae bacterium]